jgi:beta-lactamase regulating signal transducer with metallopeptidase domain
MMTVNELLISQPAAQAIAWALLQFVWQGALVGLLTATALFALRTSAADVRYVVATIGLSLMLTMPAVTAVQTYRGLQESASTAAPQPNASERPESRTSTGVLLPGNRGQVAGAVGDWLGRARPAQRAHTPSASPLAANNEPRANALVRPAWLLPLLLVWLAGVTFLTLRLLVGWMCVQGLKTRGTSPIAGEWQAMVSKLSRQLHIARPIRLLQSTLVEVPTVIGWLRPVVLMPASTLAGMAPQQLEAILAHELAHIRRHDYLVNLLQTLVETLLFYHPAVWWLSRRIRIEREHCCDDLAVSLCGDPVAYARALTDLEALRADSPRLVLAATGGSLLHRVRRLLGTPSHAGRGPGWLAATAAIFLIAGIAIGSVGRSVIEAEQPPQEKRLEPRRQPRRSTLEPSRAARARGPQVEAAVSQDVARRRSNEDEEEEEDRRRRPAAVEALRTTLRSTVRPVLRSTAHTLRDAIRGAVTEARAQYPEWFAPLPPLPPTPPLPPLPPLPAMPPVQPVPPVPPVLSYGPEPAQPPSPPEPPQPPVPPAPPEEPVSMRQGRSTHSWSDGSRKLEVKREGEVVFTDDDSDVKSLSPGGYFAIKDGGWLGSAHSVEFRADNDGKISRRYWEGWSEKAFDPTGRKWLAEALPRIIRQTGIGAPARVARILKAKGTSGVLAEISVIEGSWAKRLYFNQLLKTATLDAQAARQVLSQAGKEIESDFELASLLISASGTLLKDDQTRAAFFDAAKSIGSDFEMRRVFSSVLEHGPLSPPVLAMMLDVSTAIESDFEQASLLVQVAKEHTIDDRVRPSFFKALATVDSDFEHKRVLVTVAKRADFSPANAGAMLESATSIGSDFEKATSLLEVVRSQSIDGPLRTPFFRATESIGSAFERARVLQAVARQPNLSQESVLGVVRAASTISSNFETAQVLTVLAANHPISGEARDIYIQAAGKLGNFEEGRALSALVKSERRR